jgi:chemotaxis protein MotB
LFEPGTSQLRPKASEYLDRIGRIVQGFKGHLSIEDHSDELQLDGKKMPSLFEASVVKSVSIMNYLVAHSWMSADQIHPVVSQDSKEKFTSDSSEAAQQKNHRVEFIFSPNLKP